MAKSNKKDSSDFSYEVKEEYGYLNDKENKIVAKVSWNDKPAKYDIRSCYTKDDEIKLGKGISLTYDEIETLHDILEEILIADKDSQSEDDDEEDHSAKKKSKPPSVGVSETPKRPVVDFAEIFGEATGIMEKREAGYTTKDGFILLKRRPGVKIKGE